MKTKTFLLFWLGGTLGVLAYAFGDLTLTPRLSAERTFSMRPDLSQIGDLVHWGGRLVAQGRWDLLIPNAIVFGGLIALAVTYVISLFRKPNPDVREMVPVYDEEPAPTTLRSQQLPDMTLPLDEP